MDFIVFLTKTAQTVQVASEMMTWESDYGRHYFHESWKKSKFFCVCVVQIVYK